jgi:RHS repeat-associated protein
MIDVADNNAVYYYHFDGLGSVIALSNENKEIIERYSYDVFGEPNRTSDVNNPYMFTGRRYDPEAGLYYYRARYYDYYTGRFLQPDPIRYDDGMNLYTYCDSNPANCYDPGGLSSEPPLTRIRNNIGEKFRQSRFTKAILKVQTSGSKRKKSYRLSNSEDLLMVLIDAKVSGESIAYFEYIGHGDLSGQGLNVGVDCRGTTGIYTPDWKCDDPGMYKLDSLEKLFAEAFNPSAIIKLKGCFTAREGGIGEAFKRLLPEAEVWGYTGISTNNLLLGTSWAKWGTSSKFINIRLTEEKGYKK